MKTIKHDLYWNEDPDPPTGRKKRRKKILSFGIGFEVTESRSCFVLSTPSTAARLFQYSIRPLQSSPIKLRLLHFILIALNCALLNISSMAFCILLRWHLLRPKNYITLKRIIYPDSRIGLDFTILVNLSSERAQLWGKYCQIFISIFSDAQNAEGKEMCWFLDVHLQITKFRF